MKNSYVNKTDKMIYNRKALDDNKTD